MSRQLLIGNLDIKMNDQNSIGDSQRNDCQRPNLDAKRIYAHTEGEKLLYECEKPGFWGELTLKFENGILQAGFVTKRVKL